ncbi:MAG: anthranilate synthase component I family protein [Thermoanaerobaculia bacterium]|nr:anthranilate synthase component I family protein [Thermoanaerobaculia bacterium]
MFTRTSRLPYTDALPLYRHVKNGGPSCLFESASATDKSSRMSLIGLEPSLELVGKDERLSIRLLHPRAHVFFDFIKTTYGGFVEHETADRLELVIPRAPFEGPEEERLERQNIAQPLRRLLAVFRHGEKNFMGLYGALSYRFVYLFEDIAFSKPCPEPDFHLFLFDNILLFNHLTRDMTLYVTRETETAAGSDLQQILRKVSGQERTGDSDDPIEALQPLLFKPPGLQGLYPSAIRNPKSVIQIGSFAETPDDETFKRQVERGIRLCNEGELLEIVLSRKLTAPVQGDLLPLYEQYKAINPSPYLFYFDFGDETLLGASPEMMLRYENGRATLRPISGSVRRSGNPIEDHHLMMELLNSPKENSELDMLIDLGRNDLARICKPGIEIDHYRIIEKYSHVTHTVAQLSGELEERYSGFDALMASLNAGTLTGAPKIAAMEYIEQIEQHTRGYYGGCIGWFLFDGDVNTAITIRTAHVRDGLLSFCAGATLLYESDPENELKETKIKAGAFMAAVQRMMNDE